MKPIFTEAQFQAGQVICERLLQTMQSLDPGACLAGLIMAAVFAADATSTPLESVFQAMRELRRGFEEASKKLPDENKIIVP